MNSALKKITIDELQVGMFIVEMDISWIKSPFLLHRRAIKSRNDIILLKKSGVKLLKIDLNKSRLEQTETGTENKQNNVHIDDESSESTQADSTAQSDSDITPSAPQKFNPQNLDNPTVKLTEELEKAVILKQQANEAFNQINELVKNNQEIPFEACEPIIDETIFSLLRNSQALLTLMHLQRYEEKLFSHSFSVMTLALTFAIKDGVQQDELKLLGIAALLHDVGWAQLPLHLFGKGRKYTDNEMKVVQQHQKIANIIVGKSDSIPESVNKLIQSHHEKNDGSGYPDGITAEHLSSLAKILIVTDYYDEIVHGLLERPGVIPAEALRILYKDAVQKKLDKVQVELLIKLLGIYPLTSAVELTSGEKGVVVEVNREKPLVPVVKLMYSADGNPLGSPVIIDLEEDSKKRQVKGVVDLLDKNNDPKHLLFVEEV